MAFGITDLKKGVIFQLDSHPYKVIEYGQKVMGRGGSIVNVKIKSLLDGRVYDKTFKGSEALSPADVSNISVQYLYNDGEKYYFMDEVNYNQYELEATDVGDSAQYMKDGDKVQMLLFNNQPVSIELAKNVYLQVTYTESVVKGDTTSAITKDATLETGAIVKVPAFIKQGDIISVDTSSGVYRERKKD
jgi:elongation factor P